MLELAREKVLGRGLLTLYLLIVLAVAMVYLRLEVLPRIQQR